ncbi:aspartate kinase [Streptomyces verrucosisporus]|uniref:aspartate kinase n=1 Tax=Streptomyces verrucosisporus TaxID=1695161 RepID=UPI0019CF5803|nr:aspartate kinase [Streptomyces verrucosisporus]MBN3930691.1 aspartate kinase [Streptomyces verrucosisporus]
MALDDARTNGVVVQKYGGSSLATAEQVRSIARRVAVLARSGRRVVLVVSARGGTTDELIGQAQEFTPAPQGRELDQLLATGETASASLMALALQHAGVPATALAGPRTGILATGPHGSGIIVAIDTEHTVELLDAGHVVVIAGFQGVTAEGDVITLGRGGSDTTAVAVAAELGAPACEIYSDVPGVLTADPRVVPAARLLPSLDLDLMAEMAFAGARVMHSRAVELAALHGIGIHVGHSATSRIGTHIHKRDGRDGDAMPETRTAVTAVVHDRDVARVTLRTDRIGEPPALAVFRLLAREAIPADMTAVSEHSGGGLSIEMTVHHTYTSAVRRSLSELASPSGRGGVEVDEGVAKVSVVGKGLLSRPEYAARMLSRLTGAGIRTGALSTSQTRISVTVPRGEEKQAVRLLHTEFGLDSPEGADPVPLASHP